MFARFIFAVVDFAARKGLAEARVTDSTASSPKQHARRTGVRGETYAYWYLRRHGYVLVARNYTSPGLKGELDMVGYDGPVLAFVEVKTRAVSEREQPTPEEAVNADKRRFTRGVLRPSPTALTSSPSKPVRARVPQCASTRARSFLKQPD